MSSMNLIKIECAGSGKTWSICHTALSIVSSYVDKRVAIISYTNCGVQAVQSEIKKQNNGIMHSRITVESLYSFLLRELIKPYQSYIFGINEIISLDFSRMYGFINKHRIGQKARYMTSGRNITANEAAELVVQLNTRSNGQVIKRLEKIYATVFFDEVQDLSGYDLEIIRLIAASSIDLVCVGDPKQATFKTNNGQKIKTFLDRAWNCFSKILKRVTLRRYRIILLVDVLMRLFVDLLMMFIRAVMKCQHL